MVGRYKYYECINGIMSGENIDTYIIRSTELGTDKSVVFLRNFFLGCDGEFNVNSIIIGFLFFFGFR